MPCQRARQWFNGAALAVVNSDLGVGATERTIVVAALGGTAHDVYSNGS